MSKIVVCAAALFVMFVIVMADQTAKVIRKAKTEPLAVSQTELLATELPAPIDQSSDRQTVIIYVGALGAYFENCTNNELVSKGGWRLLTWTTALNGVSLDPDDVTKELAKKREELKSHFAKWSPSLRRTFCTMQENNIRHLNITAAKAGITE
jgi:hypothetical protein